MGPEPARWGGGLPREAVVAEKFVPSLESLSSLGFEEKNLGYPGNFAGMSLTFGGVQKARAKKLRAHFSFPISDYSEFALRAFSGVSGCVPDFAPEIPNMFFDFLAPIPCPSFP